MKRLREAGLFGGGLTVVDSPTVAARYNEGLQQLGAAPTQLSTFRIDGMGWSPEVAEEQDNPFYLCAGVANPMGLIVSPAQRRKPIYVPTHSFLRDVLDAYLARHHHAVDEITASSFVGLNVDDALSVYTSPQDLRLVTSVVVRSVVGGLSNAAQHQRALCARFMNEPRAFLDDALRVEIIASGSRWGDLRYRRVSVPDMRFDIGSFWTMAFGGLFVIRCGRKETLLVLEQGDASGLRSEANEFCIGDDALLDALLSQGVATIDLKWYGAHPEVITDRLESMLAEVYCAEHPDGDFAVLLQAQKVRVAASAADRLPPAFHGLQRLAREIAQGSAPKVSVLSRELQLLLMRPRRRMSNAERAVVWQLLCRLQPLDVLRLYKSDKNRFFELYMKWPESLKAWAVNLIRERYVPRMHTKKEA